jgi:aminoglycoside phosphotransferase (APT) family kinase protein
MTDAEPADPAPSDAERAGPGSAAAGREPGPLIGRGRAADVYALDARRVLRRYRTSHSCTAEGELMRYLRQAGYPVPEVFDADGPDLVMERIEGPDMLDDLVGHPWWVARYARVLAGLHDRLHQLTAPAGLPRPFGPGDRVLHLDLHPANVMLTADGPVVIDWSNVSAGPPGADVAMTIMIMASSDTDELPPWIRPAVAGLRRIFLSQFRAAVRDDPGPHLAPVAARRLTDVNVRPAEAARMRRLARKAQPDD